MNRRFDLPLRLDRDEPSVSGPADGDVLDRSENGSALPVANPADLGEKEPGVSFVELHALREPEGIVLALLPELREPGPFLEEVPVGPIEVLEGLLEDLGRNAGEPDGLRLPLPEREEGRCADIAQTLFSGVMPGDLEGQRPVVDEPAGPGALPEEDVLVGVRSQGEPEGLDLFHGFMVSHSCRFFKRVRLSSPP